MENIKLPSRFQIGDKVSIRIRPKFVVDSAEVIRVHFTGSKVMYDLEVELDVDSETYYTRIYNIDSAMVTAL